MPGFSSEVWLAIGGVSAIGVLGFLYAIACAIRNEVSMASLVERVETLKQERFERMKELAASSTRVTKIELAGVNATTTPDAMVGDGKPKPKPKGKGKGKH